ncbi:hypothetical protein D7Y23_30580 [Corallococcus sp. AB050B]|nr:hypothetical protein D7Y23_30580 [Corallococcus sp. AB050B]
MQRMRRGYQAAGFVVVVGLLLLAFFVLREHRATSDHVPRSAPGSGLLSFVRQEASSTRSPRITGVVRDARGPVAGVRVSASRVEPEVTLSERSCPPSEDSAPARRLTQCWDEAFDEWVDQVDKREGEAPTVAETTSAEDGTFVLDGLTGGKVSLWASQGTNVAMLPDVATGQQDVVLVLDEGRFLGGVVLDGSKEDVPIAEARITVFSLEHTRFFPATSGADGRFRIGPLPSADHGLVITAPGFRPLLSRDREPREEGTFILVHPVTFAGRVVTQNGAPAPGVFVRLYTPAAEPEWSTTLTDAQGRFSFQSHEGVYARLFAETASHDAVAHLKAEPGDDLVLTLEPAMFLQGYVSDEDGRPIPGARVQADLNDANAPSPRGQSVTDARGHYRLGPLFRLSHFVTVRAAHYIDAEPRPHDLGEAEETLDFTLSRAVSVEGILVDEAGQPLAGRRILLHPGPVRPPDVDFPIMDFQLESTETDEAGRFILDSDEAGPAWLDVIDETFVPTRFVVERPSRDVRMVLRRGARVSITVLSTAGAPVRGARVTLWKQDARGDSDHDGITDARGQATLQGVPPGSYVAEARVKRQAVEVHASQPLEVQTGEAPSVTLQLEEGRTLRGTVVNPQGLPLPGVGVYAVLLDADRPRYRRAPSMTDASPERVHTDAEGHFTLRSLSAARYLLSARLEDHRVDAALSQGVHAGEDESIIVASDTAEVRLVLRRIPHVRGRVVPEDGAALEFFEVNGSGYTNPDGRFDQPLQEATGPQWFVVRANGYATLDRSITPDGDGDVDLGTLTLSRGRKLRVFLRDAATGEPFTGRVRADDGEWATVAIGYRVHGAGVADGPPYLSALEAQTMKDGSLRLDHLPTTAFTLEVDTQLHLPARATVGEAEDSITLPLDSGARVTGFIRDAQGRPIGADLTFLRSDGLTLQRSPGPGEFTLRAIPPGHYTVSAWSGDPSLETFFPSRTVQVPASGEARVTFDALATGATVTLRLPPDADIALLLPGQAPLPDSSKLFDHLRFQQHPFEEWTRASVTFRRVPAGHYTVLVSTRDKDRIHREELDVPAEGTLSRDVKPVWSPLAR